MRLLLLLYPMLFFSQTNWEIYTDLNGRFQIDTPGMFVEKTDTLETGIGDIIYHSFFYQTKQEGEDNEVYIVSYCDYPEGIVFTDSTGMADEFFQTTIDASAESVNGKILYATDIQLEDNPGKFWRIDYLDGQGIIKTKAFLVKNRYYAIQVISYHKDDMSTSTDRFFNSFKLLQLKSE